MDNIKLPVKYSPPSTLEWNPRIAFAHWGATIWMQNYSFEDFSLVEKTEFQNEDRILKKFPWLATLRMARQNSIRSSEPIRLFRQPARYAHLAHSYNSLFAWTTAKWFGPVILFELWDSCFTITWCSLIHAKCMVNTKCNAACHFLKGDIILECVYYSLRFLLIQMIYKRWTKEGVFS